MADIISISDMRTGLQKDVHTFLRARDGFSQIVNFYPFRGRMERRKGAEVIGRLVTSNTTTLAARSTPPQTYSASLSPGVEPYSVTFTDGTTAYTDNGLGQLVQSLPVQLTITGITNAAQAVITFTTASPYVLGDVIYITGVSGMVQINGIPLTVVSSSTNTVTVTQNSSGFLAYISGGTCGYNPGTINYQSGAYSLVYYTVAPGGNPPVVVTYETYNLLPAMGLESRNLDTINALQTIAFDTRKANKYYNTLLKFVDVTFYRNSLLPFSWSGTDINFFQTITYEKGFFATNNVPAVNYLQVTGVTPGTTTSVTYTPSSTGVHDFQVGDEVVLNLVQGFTPVPNTFPYGVNGLTATPANTALGLVLTESSGTVEINIDTSTLAGTYTSGTGIIQLLSRGLTAVQYIGDGVKWYDDLGWANFQPVVTNNSVLTGCLGLIAYKGYMIALRPTVTNLANTVTSTAYNGVLWSAIGTVYTNTDTPFGWVGGFDPNAWNQDSLNGSGFTNAPTSEILTGWALYKDTLLVKFERSSWNLRYTWDSNNPFIFEKISSDFGSESGQSPVISDDVVWTVGNYGITRDNVATVARMDERIPDEVFNINNNNNGVSRVYGIRDYAKQLVYWSYPNSQNNPTYPNTVLVYNYLDGSWGKFKDYVTCFGNFQPFEDITWGTLHETWASCNFTWGSGQSQSKYPTVIAGNQQGFVFKFNDTQIEDDATLSISAITQASPCQLTITNHNLEINDFFQITGAQGMTEINTNVNSPFGVYVVLSVIDANNITIGYVDTDTASITYGDILALNTTTFGVYTYGALAAIVPDAILQTKTFSPYLEQNIKCRLTYVDLFMQATGDGQMTLSYYANQNLSDPVANSTFQFTSTTNQNYVWRHMISNISGQFIAVQLGFSNIQKSNPLYYQMSIALQIMNLTMIKSGRFMLGQDL